MLEGIVTKGMLDWSGFFWNKCRVEPLRRDTSLKRRKFNLLIESLYLLPVFDGTSIKVQFSLSQLRLPYVQDRNKCLQRVLPSREFAAFTEAKTLLKAFS